mgnify:CR=1 FL=1
MQDEPRDPSPDPPGPAGNGGPGPRPDLWRTWGGLRLLVWALACLTANAGVQAATFALTDRIFAAVAAGGLLGVLLPCALLARGTGGSLRRDFALDRPSAGVLVWSVAAALASLAPTSVLADLSTRLHPVPQHWQELYARQLPRSGPAIVMAYAAVMLVAPVAEELLFRGILQRLAARLWGAWPAAVLAALAFALLHGEPWYLFGLVGVGLLMGCVWALTRSVTACAAAHAAHNGVALTMMLRADGQETAAGGFDATAATYLAASLPALAVAIAMLGRAARLQTARRAPASLKS